jgi:hypothetical protein
MLELFAWIIAVGVLLCLLAVVCALQVAGRCDRNEERWR